MHTILCVNHQKLYPLPAIYKEESGEFHVAVHGKQTCEKTKSGKKKFRNKIESHHLILLFRTPVCESIAIESKNRFASKLSSCDLGPNN